MLAVSFHRWLRRPHLPCGYSRWSHGWAHSTQPSVGDSSDRRRCVTQLGKLKAPHCRHLPSVTSPGTRKGPCGQLPRDTSWGRSRLWDQGREGIRGQERTRDAGVGFKVDKVLPGRVLVMKYFTCTKDLQSPMSWPAEQGPQPHHLALDTPLCRVSRSSMRNSLPSRQLLLHAQELPLDLGNLAPQKP